MSHNVEFEYGQILTFQSPSHVHFFCAPLLQTKITNLTTLAYTISISSWYAYDGEERNVVAWRCKSPLRRQRQINGLGWTHPRVSGPTFWVIFGQRAWCVEHERGGDGVGIGFGRDLCDFGNNVLFRDVELALTAQYLGEATGWRSLRCWSVRGKLCLESAILSCGCHGQLLHSTAFHLNLNTWNKDLVKRRSSWGKKSWTHSLN